MSPILCYGIVPQRSLTEEELIYKVTEFQNVFLDTDQNTIRPVSGSKCRKVLNTL